MDQRNKFTECQAQFLHKRNKLHNVREIAQTVVNYFKIEPQPKEHVENNITILRNNPQIPCIVKIQPKINEILAYAAPITAKVVLRH